MNRTVFRGVSAAVLSGALASGGALAGTALASATAPSAPKTAPPLEAKLELPKHKPIRTVKKRPPHKRRVAHPASRSYHRRALVGSPRTIAHAMVRNRGWSETQWGCLETLWTRESDWNAYAENPSGAYGIPQALPASKMARFGSDWRTNPVTQIRWGLWYIASSYGTPCVALQHSYGYNYY